MGCLLLGFLVFRLGLMVLSAGEEEKNECVCVCVRARAGEGEVGNSVLSFFNKHQLDTHCCVIDCNYPTY